MLDHHVRGTLILAAEGNNGTVAATRQGIDALLNGLRQDSRLADIDCKESTTCTMPFKRIRVKIKKQIVTMGVAGIDPRHTAGTCLNPTEWNQLLSDQAPNR